MNRDLNVADFQFTPLDGNSELRLLVAKTIAALPISDEAIRDELIKVSEIRSFRLGDEIYSLQEDHFSESASLSVHNEQIQSDFYLICQGRVRLLGCRAEQSRQISVRLLETDETFGADRLLLAEPIPYRAIAASPVQVICISDSALLPLLDKYPPLRDYLLGQAQQRECLLFLRTKTTLQSPASYHLQQLVPYLSEHKIKAGESIAAAGETGRFWLRQGVISGQQSASGSAPSNVPGIGDAWGYPEATPAEWVAQTDLWVYKLSSEHWKTVSVWLPNLGTPSAAPSQSEQSVPADGAPLETLVGGRSKGRVIYQPPVRQTVSVPELQVQPAVQPKESQPVAFPKPTRRHLLDWLERYPWVEQQSSSDCGAACLSMIARYWGKQFSLNVLRERANVNRSGASLKSLAKAAEGLGFHGRPVRASFNRIAEQTNPWIAHWEGNHYIVVYAVKGDRVIVADPALGRRSLSKQEFQQHWTGYALLLDPTERLQDTEIKQASLGRYLGALLPYRTTVLQIIGFSILIQVFGLLTPLFTQIILDKVVVQKSLTTLNVFAIGLLLFGIWSIGLSAVRQYLLSYFSNRLDLTLISGFINHTLSLPLKFFESRRVGDIITRVQENQKIQRFLIQQVVLAWLSFLTGFVYLGLMLYYNWQLTLLVLLMIPPIVLLTLGATPLLRRVSREIFKEAADQNSVLVEMLTGIATVKSTAAEQEVRWRWEDHLTRQINVQFRGQILGIRLQAANGFINSLGSTALLWYGATLVIQDQLTIGQFVAFNMMIGYVISPVLTLANLWDELQEVLISVERLNDVFEAKPEETAQEARLTMPLVEGDVQFEDVTFRYGEDDEHNTLQNISFQVKAGQTVAIVGRSGSGKSTLAKLLEGLYSPNRGKVIIDGHDIRHVSPPSLRSQLGIVPQECFLFSGTILENIALYRSEYSLEEVIEVAKLAEAHTFIQSMPLGYSTKVGERGSSLSGGQRQRIAIARALLGDPRILVLDEATSSLDTESERRFQQNLAQIRRDRTTFVIAHRLSTVRNADIILVLDRGVLTEQGNHEELMAMRGLYYHLAHQQLDL
ncbi:MAG: hypothetical protein Kow00121_65240 [Elainellaceae cyanobacterium]